MTVEELNKNLTAALDGFSSDVKGLLPTEQYNETLSVKDAEELAKLVYYTLGEFQDNIIKYLREK